MAAAGLTGIFIGIESGSNRMQKILKKNNDLSLLYPVVKRCIKKGIDCKISFMMGFPEETLADLNDTLEMMLRLRLLNVMDPILNLLSPVPGTDIYYREKENLVPVKDAAGFSNFVFQSAELISLDKYHLIIKYPNIFSSFYNVRTKHIPLEFYRKLHLTYLYIFRHFSRSLYLFKKDLKLTCFEIFKAYFKYLEHKNLSLSEAKYFADFLRTKMKTRLSQQLSDILHLEETFLELSQNRGSDYPSQPANKMPSLKLIPCISRNTAYQMFEYDVFKLYKHVNRSPKPAPSTYVFSYLKDGYIKYRKLNAKEKVFLDLIRGEETIEKMFNDFYKKFAAGTKEKEPLYILLDLVRDGFLFLKS